MGRDLGNLSPIYRDAVEAPQRVLIDWDFSAHGIWKILSPVELSAPLPAGGTWGPAPAETARPRPWSDCLSSALLDPLQGWNDAGEVLLGRRESSQVTDPLIDAFYALAAELAERVQQELGSDYEVLHITPNGSWRWACRPSPRRH